MKRNLQAAPAVVTLVASLALTVALPAQKQVRYIFTDLGTLGGTYSEAVGINNGGEVAGTSTPPGDQVVHAVLWQNGANVDLGTLGGPNSVAPEAAPQPNKRGEVAGASNTPTLDPKANEFCSPFIFLAPNQYVCRPFVWRQGSIVELPTLGGNNGIAWQVNNRGLVTGIAENTTPDPTCPDAEPEGKPVIWEEDEIRELPTVSGDLDGATLASNDRAQIVGVTGNCIAGVPFTSLHAVLWERRDHRWMASDLGTLGGKILNLAFDINDRGQVVGQSDLPGDTAFHAFLWQDGIMNDLGTLPGDVVSWAETINNRGEAVGTSFDANNNMHPFIWQNGTMTNLNTFMSPGSPWVLLEALGNNDRGQIVGYAFNTISREVHGYVLTPVSDEDDSPLSASSSVSHGSVSQRLQVVLPENIRETLQRRMALRHGWLGYSSQH